MGRITPPPPRSRLNPHCPGLGGYLHHPAWYGFTVPMFSFSNFLGGTTANKEKTWTPDLDMNQPVSAKIDAGFGVVWDSRVKFESPSLVGCLFFVGCLCACLLACLFSCLFVCKCANLLFVRSFGLF